MNAGAGQTQESQRWENPERHREGWRRRTVIKTNHDGDKEQKETNRLRERERATKAQRQTDRRKGMKTERDTVGGVRGQNMQPERGRGLVA